MLCRMMPKKRRQGMVPVYLNVYDLTPINGYAYWLGLGVYHSGVQGYNRLNGWVFSYKGSTGKCAHVRRVEYAFGAHDHATSGIFEVEPKHCPGFTFRKSILIGRTDLGSKEVRGFMEKLSREYQGNAYHLIRKNCNHFCNDVCIQLTGKPIPSWVNRLARLGFLCKCVLPASLNNPKIRTVGGSGRESCKLEKKKLRSQSSRYESTKIVSPPSRPVHSASSTSRRQRRCISTSSSLTVAVPASAVEL
ncbi:DeSI-like protein [Drosera capensis]